jgi:hypothetical protein
MQHNSDAAQGVDGVVRRKRRYWTSRSLLEHRDQQHRPKGAPSRIYHTHRRIQVGACVLWCLPRNSWLKSMRSKCHWRRRAQLIVRRVSFSWKTNKVLYSVLEPILDRGPSVHISDFIPLAPTLIPLGLDDNRSCSSSSLPTLLRVPPNCEITANESSYLKLPYFERHAIQLRLIH